MATTFALRLNVALPTAAVELPASVSVHTTAPPVFTVGAPKVAVTPLGSPEATLIVAPVAPVGTVTPPTGVAVTVTVLVDVATMETEVGEAVNWIAGACCTCKAICLVAVKPSPLAVTVRVDEPTAAVDDAVRLSVAAPLSPLRVTEPLLQFAVTPLGRPVTPRLTAPLKVLLPARAMESVTVAPCVTESAVEAGVIVSVGGTAVTAMGTLCVAV